MRINKVEVHDEVQDTWMECHLRSLDIERGIAIVKYPDNWKDDEAIELHRVRGPSIPAAGPLKPGEAVEVITSSSDDEPFSWWGASVLAVMPNDAVVVAYEDWGDDYNDIFDLSMVRRANTSPVLSELKAKSKWCVIKISTRLRDALATGRLNFSSDPSAATLELVEGVVMHVSEKGNKLVLMGASRKLEKKMKGIVRHLAARASAINLVKAAQYLNSTPPSKFSKRDFQANSSIEMKRGSDSYSREEKHSGPAVEQTETKTFDRREKLELKSPELSASPKLLPKGDPFKVRSLAIDVPASSEIGCEPLVATSWSVSSLDELELSDDSLSLSNTSTNSLSSPVSNLSPTKHSFPNDPWLFLTATQTQNNRCAWVS